MLPGIETVILKVMKKSKVTTEDLARMVQGGFDDLSGRMEKGFAEVKEWQRLADGKFDVIEMELMDIKKKLENVIDRHEFELLKDRVKSLEVRLTSVKRK